MIVLNCCHDVDTPCNLQHCLSKATQCHCKLPNKVYNMHVLVHQYQLYHKANDQALSSTVNKPSKISTPQVKVTCTCGVKILECLFTVLYSA